MDAALILRGPSTDHGTFGQLYFDGQHQCYTAELPWRDNAATYSCIPAGDYLCRWRYSPKFKWCYEIKDVDGRTYILAHAGNLVGDRKKGLRTHSYGCILPGTRLGVLSGQNAVLASRIALNAIHNRFEQEDFMLLIYTR